MNTDENLTYAPVPNRMKNTGKPIVRAVKRN